MGRRGPKPVEKDPLKYCGGRTTKVYRAWMSMLDRCYNPNNAGFKNYGGRGVAVCDEWRYDFHEFAKDVGPPPPPEHSLDRVDNSGNYCKENCRWATREEQNNNRRSNKLIEHNGEIRTLQQWCHGSVVSAQTALSRLNTGWPFQEAISTPPSAANKREFYSFRGSNMSLLEISRLLGVSKSCLKCMKYAAGTRELFLEKLKRLE